MNHSAASPALAAQLPGPPPRPHRLLLVEDNPGDARLIAELLAEASVPFEVEVVHRLGEAISAARHGEWDLVMLDLSLPDSHGLETFRSMVAAAPGLPIIVLSGSDDEALALRTLEEGARDYLVKGHVDRHVLTRSVRYAFKREEMERALAQERNLLRSMIDNLLDVIYVKDAQGRYILNNQAHSRMLGASFPEGVLGQTVRDFYPDAEVRRFEEDDRYVLGTGRPILNREEVINGPNGVRWYSVTKVPLRSPEGEIVGTVGIGRDITERKDSEEQLFRYHAEIRERNAELEEDLHMAREIQQAFLPQQYPTFPRRATPSQSALHFYSRYIPTTAVGGDFFHILPISDTQAGIFICDVMGHGVRAALVTAIQRALVEEMLPVANDPGRFLTEINRALLSILRRARTPMFASAFYMVVDIKEGHLRFANAGHPTPVHLHRGSKKINFLAPTRSGPALGVFRDTRYETTTTPVEAKDLIILFTDGLYEVDGGGDAHFDQEKLLQTIRTHFEAPAEALIDDTLAEIRGFALDHVFVDDVCLVGVEIEYVLRGEAA